MAYSTSMIESIGSKPIVPEFITSKITDRKLNRDNYLQWRKIVEINLTGHEKKIICTRILLVLRQMSGGERMLLSLVSC